eukprot:evm.model.NODE_1531_length_19035_cov_17.377516.6
MAPLARDLTYPGTLKSVTVFVLVLAVVVMRAPPTMAFQGFMRARTSAAAAAAAASSRAALPTFSTLATPPSTAQSFQQPKLARHVRAATVMAARKKNDEEGRDEAAAATPAVSPRGSKPAADDQKLGRGPRNRRQITVSAEEEEFAALSDSRAPMLGEDGLPRGRPRITSRSMGPPKKRPAMTFDPTWTAKGSGGSSGSNSSGGRTLSGSTTKEKAEENNRVRPPVAAVPTAVMDERGEDEDGDEEEDEMDEEISVLPKGLKIRALDSKSYEEARRLANLSDDEGEDDDDEDWEEEDEEDEEEEEEREPLPDDIVFGDDDEDGDEDELPPLPPNKVLSMEDRLRMAETGNIFNPYVARMHTKSGPSQSQSGRGGNDLLFDELDEEEGEMEDDMSPDDAFAFDRRPTRPVKYHYKIVMDAGTCPGCGNSFQTKNDSSPGFLPSDVFQRMQSKMMTLRKTQPVKQQPGAVPLSKSAAGARRKQQQMEAAAVAVAAGLKEEGRDDGGDLYQGMTAEEEVEMLLSGKARDEFEKDEEGEKGGRNGGKAMIVMEDEEEEEDEQQQQGGRKVGGEGGEEEEDDRTVICQRCHKLKHYGEVEDSLRPGWTDNEALTPERFRELVSVIRKKRCAVVCLVDIFDFHGSLLYNLPRIVGENPVLIVVNKADLLPTDFSEERIRIWVKQELEKVGMKEVTTRHIHMVSCKTGANVKPLLRAMKLLARQRKRDLYVIGAANVGKSTFINRLIELGRSGGDRERNAKKKSKKKKQDPSKAGGTSLVTTSPLPGTTLNFIEVDLGDKVSLYDTPGLILPHQITTLLNTEELKAVIPQKRINHVTLRLKEGKSVLLGGLVRLDMVEGRPFLFTFYVSNDVKLHQTGTDRADEFLEKHIGDLVFPPFTQERRAEMGPWVARDFDIEGTGWKTSAIDIVISGLGWISITGALNCKVRVMAPEAVGVRLRSPLMPYETWATTAKWTGLRAIKSDKQKGGSR